MPAPPTGLPPPPHCLPPPTVHRQARKESRGAHAREDFSKRDDVNWMKHTLGFIDDQGTVKIDYRPVHNEPLDSEMKQVPPFARVY